MCAGAYTQAEVLECERAILAALRFSITLPTPYTFLPRCLAAFAPLVQQQQQLLLQGAAAPGSAVAARDGCADVVQQAALPVTAQALPALTADAAQQALSFTAQFVLEKATLDHDWCAGHRPSTLAAGAALVAAELQLGPAAAARGWAALAAACGPAVPWYRVVAARDAIAAVAEGARLLNPALTAVRDKYASSKYMRVALVVEGVYAAARAGAAPAPPAAAEAAGAADRDGAVGATG